MTPSETFSHIKHLAQVGVLALAQITSGDLSDDLLYPRNYVDVLS